jgi:1-phosphofructokinase
VSDRVAVLTVTVNPSLDRTYPLGTLRLGEVNRAGADTVEASGKGVNVSRALHAAGVATAAVLPAGGPEGEQLAGLLALAGLPFVAVPTGVATRTNVTLVEAGGRTTKVNSPGRPLSDVDYAALVDAVSLHAASARWTVFSGSLPPGADPAILPRLVAAARSAGSATAVDTSGPALAAAAGGAGVPDLLAPNAEELAAVAGVALPGGGAELVAAAATAARVVAARSGAAQLVSLGADGALWIPGGGGQGWHAVGPRVVPVNTAGAGDALLAGWFAGGEAAGAEDARLARAVAWGTAACLMAGTAGDVAATADVASVRVTALVP